MITKTPILVTGCSRSGASMITAAINACGAFGGDMFGRNGNPRRGMFENIRIRETVVKPYLLKLGLDTMGQYPLPDTYNLTIPKNWKDSVERILSEEGYKGGPWVYKDSRNCLLWPIWDSAFPEAKWIIVRRRTGDVVQSCKKTAFMKAFKDPYKQKLVGVNSEEEGWLWWIHQFELRFINMTTEGISNYKIIWPERMVNGDYGQFKETLEWLGLTWNDEVLKYIESLLWGKRKEVSNGKSKC